MLKELHQALVQLFTPLALPVYLADCVPEGAYFPYIIAEAAVAPLPGQEGSLTLTLWCAGCAANTERFLLTERMLEYLPARGLRLTLAHGMAALRMTDSTCLRSGEALGIRTGWTLHCQHAA